MASTNFGRSSYSFFIIIYIFSLQILNTNTRSSATHWKLVVDNDGTNIIRPNPDGLTLPSRGTGDNLFSNHGKENDPKKDILHDGGGNESFIKLRASASSSSSTTATAPTSQRHGQRQTASSTSNSNSHKRKSQYWISPEENDELVLKILATTVVSSKGLWTKYGHEFYCSNCPMPASNMASSSTDSGQLAGVSSDQHLSGLIVGDGQDVLDCGRPANFTYYDQLIGVANRQSHPHIPEPQVAMVFRKKGSKKDTIDLNTLERKLKKAKKDKPSSVQLYNQIGNFWRIKGNTLRAIECFRRALAVAPNNPEVLHNLARLLLTLQYLDDALFLARRSLELQAPDRSAWQQHFTLGEILKAYGHHQEAVLHFKHTLELRPDHGGAQDALRELEALLAGTGRAHICTLLIIIFLVLGVLLVMLSSLENEEPPDLQSSSKPPRHFSRALAMKSLRLGISARSLRSKRIT